MRYNPDDHLRQLSLAALAALMLELSADMVGYELLLSCARKKFCWVMIDLLKLLSGLGCHLVGSRLWLWPWPSPNLLRFYLLIPLARGHDQGVDGHHRLADHLNHADTRSAPHLDADAARGRPGKGQ